MKRAQPGWLLLSLAAIAAAIGSALPFYTFDGGLDLTVWHRNLFPVATIIPLFLFGIGLEAMFVLAMGYEPRSPFLNFTWSQARLAASFFAMLLALSFLVQGRAGGDIGIGYIVLAASSVAAFAGSVMTRRAELAHRREELVEAEHPWRATVLRWRSNVAEKVNAFASGANPSPPRVQPAPEPPAAQEATDVPSLVGVQSEKDEAKDEEEEEEEEKEEEVLDEEELEEEAPELDQEDAAATAEKEDETEQPAEAAEETPEETTPEPAQAPRLSAVQSDSGAADDEKPEPADDEKAETADDETAELAAADVEDASDADDHKEDEKEEDEAEGAQHEEGAQREDAEQRQEAEEAEAESRASR